MRAFLIMLMAGAALAGACGWDAPQPAAFAPVPGNPCGNLGVPCLDSAGKESGFCCDEGETCGGNPGCPPGACCNVRMPPAFLKKSDSGIVENQMPVVVVTHPMTRADGGSR
jgi:hypothetical protein